MQKKSVTLLRILVLASLFTLSSSLAAQDALSSFEESLKKTGWSVQRTADGSLILESKAASETAPEKNSASEDQWLQLQNKLQAAGWLVEREADGSLRLTPQPQPQPQPDNAVEPKADTHSMATDEENSFQGMQQKLQEAGWRVTKSPDGSMLLYPPNRPDSVKPEPCPGAVTTASITLPVNSWQEAHDITQEWLNEQPPFNATIGKIRQILNVYVVSIVAGTAPYGLIQQIAIRSSDGAVIVLN